MPKWVYPKKGSPFLHYDFVLDGRRFSGSCHTKNRQTARKYVERLRDQILAGDYGRPQMTLGQAATLYFETHGQHQKRSCDWIEDNLTRLCKALGSTVLLSAIGTPQLAAYVARRRQQVGASTVNGELTIYRAMWRHARDVQEIEVGPEPKWKLLRLEPPAPRQRFLNDDERAELADKLGTIRPELIHPFVFCLLTGARLGSAMRLT
jgi:hypothetical protein